MIDRWNSAPSTSELTSTSLPLMNCASSASTDNTSSSPASKPLRLNTIWEPPSTTVTLFTVKPAALTIDNPP